LSGKLPPESSVVLAAKYKCAKLGGAPWEDRTPAEREVLMDIVRDQISSGPLLTKAKYLARVGADSWDNPYQTSAYMTNETKEENDHGSY
jgi:hypothetical protein